IIHIMARTQEKAQELLHTARESGFKRTGIQSLKEERILIEVLSTERIDAPVMEKGKKLVSDEYITNLTKKANSKYDTSTKKLKKLQQKI
ncbi:MAG: hypothetical protein V1744_07365, partial [Candidatus Altiarchaeota archaeon]